VGLGVGTARAKNVTLADILSLPEASESVGRSTASLLGLALRDPRALPVYVMPEPPGWAVVPWVADAGARVPTWREEAPPWSWYLLRGPIRLSPDLLREALATAVLRRLTSDGASVRALRSQVGYLSWSIENGVVQIDEATRTETPVLRCVRLCEDQRIGVESLLIDRRDVALLYPDAPREKIGPGPLRAEDIVSEDRAARALPWRRRDAVAWLRREGLSVMADGRRVVVWAAVLERLRPDSRALTPAPARAPRPLARPGRTLD